MDTRDRDLIRAWLEAEHADSGDAADRAFASVAVALPRRAPSRRFVAGVMARVRTAEAAPASLWMNWWVRAGIGASLALLGTVLGTVSWRGAFDTALTVTQTVVWGVDRIVTGFQAWASSAGTVFAALAHAGIVLARLLTAPGPALVVTLNLLLAAGALAALQRLLVTQEKH